MKFLEMDDVSIGVTAMFARIVGFWMTSNNREKRIQNIALIYTLFAINFASCVMITDFIFSWGDFSACLFNACTTISVFIPFFKVVVLLAHKKDFFGLILHVQTKFLHGNYDDTERKIIFACKRQCTFFVCSFIFCTKATVVSYILNPIIANIGKNASERVLPFNIWIDLPLSTTPYYEITFCIQVLSLYHVSVNYFCFDNFFCIMNLHVASQFRILQYRMANASLMNSNHADIENEKGVVNTPFFTDKQYDVFKNCVRQHQALIAYCDKVEEVFNWIVLGQVLAFSIIICLDGYQVLMPEAPTRTRVIFSFHLVASLCQLLMFSYSCDCIIRESLKVAPAIYGGPWSILPFTNSARMLRKDLVLVIARSYVPCCLTAKGFFVVSLETYTGVLSTAASYFTLLKQSSESLG